MSVSWARLTVLSAVLSYGLTSQSRFGDGEFKGFSKSPTEHIVNRYGGVVETRRFEGSVVDPTGALMHGAIVEVRGPGTSTRVSGTITDDRGRFTVGRLKKGMYTFKITLNGFQSVAGQLRIDASEERKPLTIILQFGV